MSNSITNIHPAIIFFLLVSLLSFPLEVQAQDVEGFFKEIKARAKNDPVKITGGVSAGTNFSHTTGIAQRYAPFTWNFNAHINFDILGIKAPFSLNYSNGNSTYKLPAYHFYGISPSYKWITLHFGDRSMNFSPYSLAGHNFFGSGIELTPGKFRFSAMYGRLKRATAADLDAVANIDPSYKRMGYGFKAGYVAGKDEIFVSYFSARDDSTSFSPTPEFDVKAKENIVLELNAKKHIGKRLYFAFDIARSIFTSDIASPDVDSENGFLKTYGGLISPKASTGYYYAVKGSVGFRASKTTNFQFNYEKVDPGYRSLGALFFNDDLENFTVSGGTSLFKNKLNLTGSIGLQRDNLSGFESLTNNRLIGNLNATFVAGKRAILNGSYSNFRNASKVRYLTNPFSPVDSVSLVLVNQNANLSFSYTLGEAKNAMLNTMLSYQTSNSILNEELQENQQSDVITGSINYAYTFPESKLVLSAGLTGNYSTLTDLQTFFYAPMVAASKSFLKDQLSSSASLAYSSVFVNNIIANRVFNFRLQLGYKVKKRHHASLTLGLLERSVQATNGAESFFEFVGGARYRYSF